MKRNCILWKPIISVWVFIVFCAIISSKSFSDTVTLEVDASTSKGGIPYLFRAGVFLNSLPVDYPLEKFFRDQRPGQMEFSWDFYPELLQCNSLKEFINKLPSSNLSQWVKRTNDLGGECLIRLMPVPKWLWGKDDGFRNPPLDYDGWAKFVEGIVNYFNNQLHIDAKYVVWDEPDGFWHGTERDYLELYKHSVLGVKKANKQAKIGGPATSGFEGKINKGASIMPLMYNFIAYCSRTGLPELGMSRLPIDFIVWHVFDAVPISPGRYDLEVGKVKKWLTEFGYDANMEMNIGSWNALKNYPSVGLSGRDNEFLAAYIVSSILAMDKAGIQRHIFFNLFEDWIKTDKKTEFIGEQGLITRSYVVKPAYNAFKAMGMLKGKRLDVKLADPFLSAVISMDEQNMYLLISNFIPPDEMLKRSVSVTLNVKGYRKTDLKRYGLDRTFLEELLNKRRPLEDIQIPERVKDDIRQVVNYAQKAKERQKIPVDMEIQFKNMPFEGNLKYSQYLIDVNHSNCYAIKEKVDGAVKRTRNDAWQEGIKYLSKIWSKEEIDALQSMRERKVALRELFKKVTEKKKKDLLEAQKVDRDYFYRKIDDINEWPAVKLQKVEEDIIQPSRSFRKGVSLEPYAVALIVLSAS
ncbi:MAG: hypothetical protein HUU08_02180 [Candidatus Brocadia sp.]|nr:hypothetical protein [Candidatus Brocadia sp.]